MKRTLGTMTAVLGLLAALTACSDDDPLDGAAPGPVPTADGRRWESFGDVELSVPNNWGHSTGDVASALWCISDAGISPPTVIRPGIDVESTCPGPADGEPDPATLVSNGGSFVSMVFAAGQSDVTFGDEGDRTTVRAGAVIVRVQAAEVERRRILDTLRDIDVDKNGCGITHPISRDPGGRPVPGTVPQGTDPTVRSVTACRYAIPGGRFAAVPDPGEEEFEDEPGDPAVDGLTDEIADEITDEPTDGVDEEFDADLDDLIQPTITPLLPAGTPVGRPTLLGSVALDGRAAVDAVRAVAEAPTGTGPDAESGCADDVHGTEAIVVRIMRDGGTAEAWMRYGGCGNGFDDGVVERRLTREAVAPFVSGANSVPAYGEELVRILDDPNAPATSGDPEEDDAGSASPSPTSTPTASPRSTVPATPSPTRTATPTPAPTSSASTSASASISASASASRSPNGEDSTE